MLYANLGHKTLKISTYDLDQGSATWKLSGAKHGGPGAAN